MIVGVYSGTQVAPLIKKLNLDRIWAFTLYPGQHWVTVLTLVPADCPLVATPKEQLPKQMFFSSRAYWLLLVGALVSEHGLVAIKEKHY